MNATSPEPRVAPAWFVVLDGALAVLLGATVAAPLRRRLTATLPWLTPRALRTLVGLTILAHGAEAAAATSMARRRGLPARPWATSAALVGFPALMTLRRIAPLEQVLSEGS